MPLHGSANRRRMVDTDGTGPTAGSEIIRCLSIHELNAANELPDSASSQRITQFRQSSSVHFGRGPLNVSSGRHSEIPAAARASFQVRHTIGTIEELDGISARSVSGMEARQARYDMADGTRPVSLKQRSSELLARSCSGARVIFGMIHHTTVLVKKSADFAFARTVWSTRVADQRETQMLRKPRTRQPEPEPDKRSSRRSGPTGPQVIKSTNPAPPAAKPETVVEPPSEHTSIHPVAPSTPESSSEA